MEIPLENMLEYGKEYGKKTIVASLSLLSLLYIGLTTPCCGRGGHNGNDTPTIPNNPPVAKAIFSYSTPINPDYPAFIRVGGGVVLDGSCSSDPDGDNLSYLWSMNKKPAGSSLTDKDIFNRDKSYPLFFPDVEGDYTLELRVTDEKGASALAYMTISAQTDASARPHIRPADGPKQRRKAGEEHNGGETGRKSEKNTLKIINSIKNRFKKK